MEQLQQGILRRANPVLVGLDPQLDSIPGPLVRSVVPKPTGDIVGGVLRFCQGVIDVVCPLVAAVKPQAAFFEQLGPPGMAALGEVVHYAQSKGLLVILDAKRNDIGSTARAYAEGILGRGRSPWGADAVTVNPYLGDDAVAPFVEVAVEREAAAFVLVKTSNPGGRLFQDLVCDGRAVYQHVGAHVEELARQTVGSGRYGAVGAVVGATYPEQLAQLRSEMPHAWFLVPGFGAQGAGARDVAGAFDPQGMGALINNSRGIIFAHQRPEYAGRFGPSRWQEAVEAATRDMIDQLRRETPAGRLAGGT